MTEQQRKDAEVWHTHREAVKTIDAAGITDLDDRQAVYDLLVHRPLERWQRERLARMILTDRENRENSGGSGRS